jgi:hypothetical protein
MVSGTTKFPRKNKFVQVISLQALTTFVKEFSMRILIVYKKINI